MKKNVILILIFLIVFCLVVIICSHFIYNNNNKNNNDKLYEKNDENIKGSHDINKKYENGTAVYYNPVIGKICEESEAISTTETKTGCMKWYVYNDDIESTTINMILDHNTTAGISWWNFSEENISSEESITYEESNIKKELDGLVSWSKWKDTPRLITIEEIKEITENTNIDNPNYTNSYFLLDNNNELLTEMEQGANKYAWLFDYTSDCERYGCSVEDNNLYVVENSIGTKSTEIKIGGYWTSSVYGKNKYSSIEQIWHINWEGVFTYDFANVLTYGIRPVITIPKSKLL